MEVIDFEAFRKSRGGGVKALMMEPETPPVVGQLEGQHYMLDRVVQAALIHKVVFQDIRVAEDLWQLARASFLSGNSVALVEGELLQNVHKALKPELHPGQDSPFVRLVRASM